jgi:hypothetical protein
MGSAKQSLDENKEKLSELKSNLMERRYGNNQRVIVARALGEKEGFYKDGRTKVENHPLNRTGKVTEIDGQMITVYMFDTGDYKKFHADELDRLKRIDNIRPIMGPVAAIIKKFGKDYTTFDTRRTELITDGVDTLRTMGFADAVIGYFLSQHISRDRLPTEVMANPFDAIKKLERGIDYQAFEKDARTAVLEKLQIAPTLKGKVDLENLTTTLAEGVLHGYKIGELIKPEEKLREGCLLVRTQEADRLARGLVGKYEDICSNYEEGIHVFYIGDENNRRCTTKRVHAHAKKAYEVPTLEEKKRELLAQIIPTVQEALLPIQEKYGTQIRDLAEQSRALAGDLVDLGMTQDQINNAFRTNIDNPYYLRGKK